MTTQVKTFNGLNNVADPLRMGLSSLVQADNVNITSSGRVERRSGYELARSGAYTGAYTTIDYSRLFVVDAGQLKKLGLDLTETILATGLTSAPMYWTEVNREVFYSNGPDKGIIGVDNQVRAWLWTNPLPPVLKSDAGSLQSGLYQVCCTFLLPDGRETGASDPVAIQVADGSGLRLSGIPQAPGLRTLVYVSPADSQQFQFAFEAPNTAATWSGTPDSLGTNLTTLFLDPPPVAAKHVAFFAGRMYAMQYLPENNTTVVWFSEPLGFHLFNLDKSFMLVRGRGVLLAAHSTGLVIGTTTEIHAFDGERLTQLANYGAVEGWSAAVDDNDTGMPLYFWTQRGVCTAFPFRNLTALQVSVPPGAQAGGAVISTGGARRYVVALEQSGSAFNPRIST